MEELWNDTRQKGNGGIELMRLHIAIIIPYVQGIFGQIVPLTYANKLSEEHRVDLIVYKMNRPVLEEV